LCRAPKPAEAIAEVITMLRGESRKPLGRYPKGSSQEADGTVGSPHITRPRQPISNEDAAGGHDEYAGDAQQRALRRLGWPSVAQ
jgi:hypothetical protein